MDESDAKAGEASSVYDDLSMFVRAGTIDSEEMRIFFADEAARAGVEEIRAMRQEEKPEPVTKGMTGCGTAYYFSGLILIDADRQSCLSPAILAHEIAHFPASVRGCKGHGPIFYEINEEIARRFEARFPGVLWEGLTPVERVRKRSLEYSTPCLQAADRVP